jgi:hypothetical protein
MRMDTRIAAVLTLLVSLWPLSGGAQQAPPTPSIGTVTALQGQATVGRQALPQPTALKFRDDVFFRDQIATKEKSTVRLLLGGKGVLTVREQSQVTLDETVAPTGERRSILTLLGGKIGAAIARSLMGAGEEVEIRTPNAVAAVRGTVLIVEYLPPQTRAEGPQPVLLASTDPGVRVAQAGLQGGQSTFLVLTGSVTVTAQGAAPVTVGAMQSVTVSVTATGDAQVGPVHPVTAEQAAQAAQGLQVGMPHKGEAETARTAQMQAQVAAAVVNAIIQGGEIVQVPSPVISASDWYLPVKTNPGNVIPGTPGTGAPLQATDPQNAGSQGVDEEVKAQEKTPGPLVLTPGPLLKLSNVTLGLPAGMSLATFTGGSPSASASVSISGAGTPPPVVVPTGTPIVATGTPISHSGSIVTLDATSAIVGASTDVVTPLIKVSGTTLENSGGALISSSGGAITLFGPMLGLVSGGSATLSGLLSGTAQTEVALDQGGGVVLATGTGLTATDSLFRLEGGSTLSSFSGGNLVSIDPSTLTLQAPILSAVDSAVSLTGSVLKAVNSTVTGTGEGKLVFLQNSSLDLSGPSLLNSHKSDLSFTAPLVTISDTSEATSLLLASAVGVPLFKLDGGSLTLTGNGALLDVTGGSVEVAGSLFEATGTAALKTTGATGPLVKLTNATLSLANGGSLLSWNGATATGIGTALDSTNGTIAIDGPIFALRGGSKVTFAGSPLIRLSGSTLLAQGGFGDSDGTGNQANITGTLLDATDSVIAFGSGTIGPPDTTGTDQVVISTPAGVPQVRLSNSVLTEAGDGSILGFPSGTSTYAGLLLDAKDSLIVMGGSMLEVCCGDHVTTTSPDPLIKLTGQVSPSEQLLPSDVVVSGNFLGLMSGTGSPSSLSLAGPFLSATDSFIEAGDPTQSRNSFIFVGDGSQLSTTSATAPLIQSTRSSIFTSGDFLTIGRSPSPATPSTVTLAGPLAILTDSEFISTSILSASPCCGFLFIGEGGKLVGNGGSPLLQFSGTTIDADAWFADVNRGGLQGIAAPSSMTLAGPFLSDTGGDLALGQGLLRVANGSTLTASTALPLLQFSGSTVSLGGNLFNLSSDPDQPGGTATLAGALLTAANSSFDIGTSSVVSVSDGAALTSTTKDPLLGMSGGSLTTTDGMFLNLNGPNSQVSLAGPLLSTTNTDLSLGGSLVHVANGGRLASTTTDSLIRLSGGTHTLGGSAPSLLDLSGVNTDPSTGLGVDIPLQTGGAILEFNNTTVNLADTGGHAIKLDTALLTASAPIMKLINSTMSSSTEGAGGMHLHQSLMAVTGTALTLDKSVITIQNGPLLTLTGGSVMVVNGDLASLMNGSKIMVLNGPLIFVDGVNAKGTPSTLTVSGALVNFGGTGGNQVIINNTIAPNAFPGNVPVSITGTGSSITIGPNPIKNPGLGAFSIAGSVIQATNGGKVVITAK